MSLLVYIALLYRLIKSAIVMLYKSAANKPLNRTTLGFPSVNNLFGWCARCSLCLLGSLIHPGLKLKKTHLSTFTKNP